MNNCSSVSVDLLTGHHQIAVFTWDRPNMLFLTVTDRLAIYQAYYQDTDTILWG